MKGQIWKNKNINDKVVVLYYGEYSVLYHTCFDQDPSLKEVSSIVKKGLKSIGLLCETRKKFDSSHQYLYTMSIEVEE